MPPTAATAPEATSATMHEQHEEPEQLPEMAGGQRPAAPEDRDRAAGLDRADRHRSSSRTRQIDEPGTISRHRDDREPGLPSADGSTDGEQNRPASSPASSAEADQQRRAETGRKRARAMQRCLADADARPQREQPNGEIADQRSDDRQRHQREPGMPGSGSSSAASRHRRLQQIAPGRAISMKPDGEAPAAPRAHHERGRLVPRRR